MSGQTVGANFQEELTGTSGQTSKWYGFLGHHQVQGRTGHWDQKPPQQGGGNGWESGQFVSNRVRSPGPQPDQQDQNLCKSQESGVWRLICSFLKHYLQSTYYVSGTVLGTGGAAVNLTEILGGELDKVKYDTVY
jgi:hypothetical protein